MYADSEEDQAELDDLKSICQCNISQCYYRLGEYRYAVETVTTVLKDHPLHLKSLYHRAKAYRALDEYEKAMADLEKALVIDPKNVDVHNELLILRKTMAVASTMEKHFASTAMSLGASHTILKSSSLRDSSASIFSGSERFSKKKTFLFEDDSIPLEPMLHVLKLPS